jgi:CelD/BcsL family acetyltransferase involved in cellulose biosynthesis
MELLQMRQDRQDEIRFDLAESRADWEEACAGFTQATAFHRYDFLSAVAPCLHSTFVPLVVYFRSRKVGVAPLLTRQYGPFCVINSGPLPYLGPLVPAELIPATLAALSAEARRRRALDHYQFFSPFDSPPAVDGFRMQVDRTFIIPLRDRSDEDLLRAMNPGRRKEIRRAEQIGLGVHAAEPEDFELMDAWNKQLYAAQGLVPVFPAGTYGRIFRALSGTPDSTFCAARMDGRTVGVQINLAASRRVFAWQYAIDKSFKPCSPQSILMWYTALQARDAGASELDLVGAPNEGIATYKLRLGAEERGYVVMRRPVQSYRLARAGISRMLVGTRKSVRRA